MAIYNQTWQDSEARSTDKKREFLMDQMELGKSRYISNLLGRSNKRNTPGILSVSVDKALSPNPTAPLKKGKLNKTGGNIDKYYQDVENLLKIYYTNFVSALGKVENKKLFNEISNNLTKIFKEFKKIYAHLNTLADAFNELIHQFGQSQKYGLVDFLVDVAFGIASPLVAKFVKGKLTSTIKNSLSKVSSSLKGTVNELANKKADSLMNIYNGVTAPKINLAKKELISNLKKESNKRLNSIKLDELKSTKNSFKILMQLTETFTNAWRSTMDSWIKGMLLTDLPNLKKNNKKEEILLWWVILKEVKPADIEYAISNELEKFLLKLGFPPTIEIREWHYVHLKTPQEKRTAHYTYKHLHSKIGWYTVYPSNSSRFKYGDKLILFLKTDYKHKFISTGKGGYSSHKKIKVRTSSGNKVISRNLDEIKGDLIYNFLNDMNKISLDFFQLTGGSRKNEDVEFANIYINLNNAVKSKFFPFKRWISIAINAYRMLNSTAYARPWPYQIPKIKVPLDRQEAYVEFVSYFLQFQERAIKILEQLDEKDLK